MFDSVVHTVTLSYTPVLVRRAVFAYIRRGMGLGGFAALFCLLTGTGVVLASRPSSWLAGVSCGVSAVLLALLAGLYIIHYRQGLAKLRRLGEPHALLELSETELRVSSQGGSFSAPWSSFTAIWRFSDFWLLILGHGQFMTIPLASLTPEARAFLSSHIDNAQSAA